MFPWTRRRLRRQIVEELYAGGSSDASFPSISAFRTQTNTVLAALVREGLVVRVVEPEDARMRMMDRSPTYELSDSGMALASDYQD